MNISDGVVLLVATTINAFSDQHTRVLTSKNDSQHFHTQHAKTHVLAFFWCECPHRKQCCHSKCKKLLVASCVQCETKVTVRAASSLRSFHYGPWPEGFFPVWFFFSVQCVEVLRRMCTISSLWLVTKMTVTITGTPAENIATCEFAIECLDVLFRHFSESFQVIFNFRHTSLQFERYSTKAGFVAQNTGCYFITFEDPFISVYTKLEILPALKKSRTTFQGSQRLDFHFSKAMYPKYLYLNGLNM